jgi:hypothetical protein
MSWYFFGGFSAYAIDPSALDAFDRFEGYDPARPDDPPPLPSE